MLVDLMGMGKDPRRSRSTTRCSVRSASSTSRPCRRPPTAARRDRRIEPTSTPRSSTTTSRVACGPSRRARRRPERCRGRHYHDGHRLVAEEYWTCTEDIPQWDLAIDGMALRVIIDGAPDASRVDLRDRQRPGREVGIRVGWSARGGHDRSAGDPVRARNHRGVVVPEIFGAYRWR